MTPAKTIAAVALAGGAAYLLFVRRSAAGTTLLEEFASSPRPALATAGPGNLSGAGPATTPSRATTAIGLIGASSAAVGSLFAAGGSTAAAGAAGVAASSGGGTAAVAGAGGIGAAGAIALTGGIAGGVLLTWAIVEKGLWRGGWEGITGNRLRDKFFDTFVQQYYPGAGSEKQYDAFTRFCIEAGIPHDETSRLITQLYAADTEREMMAAFQAVRDALARRGITNFV